MNGPIVNISVEKKAKEGLLNDINYKLNNKESMYVFTPKVFVFQFNKLLQIITIS